MFNSERRQILIVDSDIVYVSTLVQILHERGFDTLTAVSAQGAVQKAESLDIDFVIIGEEVDGALHFDLCRQLKGTRRTEHIPVLCLVSGDDPESRINSYRKGADDCIGRIFHKEELFARMGAIWRRGNGSFRDLKNIRQQEVSRELSRIIDGGLVRPYFQPIYFIKPFRLLGLEVLSRPQEGSFIRSADEMFRAAIQCDMYYPLEMMCWQKALDQVTTCSRNEHLFFNCSPHIVENSRYQTVHDVFQRNKVPLNKVVLEITERSAINSYEVFFHHLKHYRDKGFSFAIDDVGSGYASLESIVSTKPEVVKIDLHIVRQAQFDPIKQSIIRFIVAFCKENQIISVAEGVETKEEMDVVIKLGVDAAQGYYLFRPTPSLNLREMKDLCVAFS